MKAIVSVDINWGIGYKQELLQRIPEDMKYFRKMTLGNVVVMGRETFESLPGKEPLKDRINIVLSRNPEFIDRRIVICRSLEQLLRKLKNYPLSEIFVIGGQEIYNLLLPYCTEAYVTKIEKAFLADKFFVNIDQDPDWQLESQSDIRYYLDVPFFFARYKNIKIKIIK